ncbi:MAG: hypothetical protein AB2693_06490 [Candidatus Thiodiazotropha sp.]
MRQISWLGYASHGFGGGRIYEVAASGQQCTGHRGPAGSWRLTAGSC